MTYRTPDLAPGVLDACDGIMLTKIADRRLAARLFGFAYPTEPSPEWLDVVANLPIGQAVLLPTSAEQEHGITRFTFARRRTEHVRHRQKYVDVGVLPGREFVFTRNGRATEHRVGTLRELMEVLPTVSDDVFAGHLVRGDFHRWIEEVVGDRYLGEAIRGVESGDATTARETIVHAIRDRYLDPESEPGDGG